MIRVLHIVTSLGNTSGVINFIMNYYKNIDRSKVQFDFLYFYDVDNSMEKEIVEMGGKVYKIGIPKKKKKFFNTINLFFSKNKYDIIHCHPIFGSFFFGKTARKNGVKTIIQHSHTSKYGKNIISSFRNKLLFLYSKKNITDFAACSKNAAKLLGNKTGKFKTEIFKNAIDISNYSYSDSKRDKIRNEFNINSDDFVIGHIGRFSVEKNHEWLIDFFADFLNKKDNSKLFLVGRGPTKNNIEKKVKELGIEDKVIFAGIRNDINDILSAVDTFILPSKFEGLGIVAVEAQAAGLVTICSSGVPDDILITKNSIKFNLTCKDRIIDYIIEKNGIRDLHTEDLLSKAGYDIKSSALKLQNFYIHIKLKRDGGNYE